MQFDKQYIQKIIQRFDLKPLPVEGGLFSRSYISDETIHGASLPERYRGVARNFGSAIYAMMVDEPDCFSTMHRLLTDEVYHFYLGDAIEMLLLYPDGSSKHVELGQDIFNGQNVQFVVPSGVWQGFHLKAGGRFALIGTTMAPAFHVEDFEVIDRETLLKQYPHEEHLIIALTRQQEIRRMKPGEEA